VRAIMDEVVLEDGSPQGTVVRMRKRLSS
jgi:hypothetical protein